MVKMGPDNKGTVPFTGELVRPAEEKFVQGATDLLNQARYNDKLAKQIEASRPEVWKVTTSAMKGLSSAMGGAFQEELTGLTPQEIELRGVIGRDFAATTKDLYGANFTASEQKRAGSFTPQLLDSAAVIAGKIRGAAEFNREMVNKYGPKAVKAATNRMGGASPLRSKYGLDDEP
jgi:hypothetical protein